MSDVLSIYATAYGALALGHIVVQMVFGQLEYRRQRREARDPSYGALQPTVTVIVPAYDEDATTLRRCLLSLARQRYDRLDVIVVDDGSPGREEILSVYEQFATGRFSVLLPPANHGKRHVQKAAFDEAHGEIIVTIDSDTILHDPECVRKLVQRFADPRVGAVTGCVAVENTRDNLLTRLIGYRYWSAFHQERAAQSYFRVVMCCSGPLSAYRRAIIDRVKEAYVSQRFLGELCTYGDDRHLTNLVLDRGYKVVFDGRSMCHTAAPTRLPQYVRQQTRWNKSFFREMLWTARFGHRHHPYMMLDMTLQAVLPFMLVGALGVMLAETVADGPGRLVHYAALLMAIAVARSAYGIARTRDPGFLTFVVYGFMHVLVLIPVRFYALATLRRTHWGTRAAPDSGVADIRAAEAEMLPIAGLSPATAAPDVVQVEHAPTFDAFAESLLARSRDQDDRVRVVVRDAPVSIDRRFRRTSDDQGDEATGRVPHARQAPRADR